MKPGTRPAMTAHRAPVREGITTVLAAVTLGGLLLAVAAVAPYVLVR